MLSAGKKQCKSEETVKGSNVLKSFSLYQKFALTIVLLGLLPMAVLTTFIANKMIKDYSLALTGQYEQAAGYVASSGESKLDS